VRRLATLFVAVLLIARPSYAQREASVRPYVIGGWSTASRDRGNFPDSLAEVGPHRSLVPSLRLAAAVRVRPWLGVEGEVDVQAGQSFPWRHREVQLAITEQRTTDRDTPVVGYVRFARMRS
jgi:hypothetical protein